MREALSQQIMKLPTLLGKRLTTDHLIGGFLTFLKDEEIPIRVQVLKHLDPLVKVIGADKLNESILPALQELAEHKNWRVKLDCMDILVYFA